MKAAVVDRKDIELHDLCSTVRTLVKNGEYDECKQMIRHAMEEYPDSPEPHNLMGVVLEQVRDHATAMRHFRAAYALDPTYRPASQNLNNYGTFFSDGKCAFDESDCVQRRKTNFEIEYNDYGVSHVIRRK